MVTNSVSRSRWGESVGAISPFFCSSKSLASPNGRPPRACLSTSKVNFDGALPLGWKYPIYCTMAQPVKDPQTEAHLPSLDQLRNNAAECIRLAEAARTSAHKSFFIEMADRWLTLAERAAKTQDR